MKKKNFKEEMMKKNIKEGRKKEIKRRNLKEEGITLIALVVTMIILLILAGVTVSLVVGQNGLLQRAQMASNTMANATANELAQMGQYASDIESLTSGFIAGGGSQQGGEGGNGGQQGGGSTADFTITDSNVKPASSTTAVTPLSTEKTVSLEDNKGNIVKVPKNFGIAYDSGDNVAEGIVIEYTGESDSDPLKGNQYVWVPVGQAITKTDGTTMPAITLGRYDFDAQKEGSYPNYTITGSGAATLKQNADEWNLTTDAVKITPSWWNNGSTYEFAKNESAGSSYGNTKANDLEGFINSAKSNHGYYIARYEAGSGAANGKPYTQKNKLVWDNITQPNAATACQGMYAGANSDLVNSYAWDTAIVYIQQSTGSNEYSKANRGSNTSKVNTGMTSDEQCKINDMAKNVREWTTESSTWTYYGNSYPCVGRGGNSYEDGDFTANRSYGTTSNSGSGYGFRPLMYL